jgi:uncharacterized protein YecT (DUF1311 family)
MRRVAAAVFVVQATLFVFSQDSPQYQACMDKAKAQMEMNQCAGQEESRVDARMNEVYKQLLAKAADDQSAVAKIKAAERAWVAYRDSYCDAMYPAEDKRMEYGSIFPMDMALLRAKLTQQHIADLQELLKQY